jgi:enamidase
VTTALHIRNLGAVLAADPHWGFRPVAEILCAEGRIVALGDDVSAELSSVESAGARVTTVDAAGLTAVPGLIDGHVHPVTGSVSVVPPGIGWTDTYLQAGVTSCVSAGELTTPGFNAQTLTPDAAARLAAHAAWSFGGIATPPRVYAGTLLVVPGMERSHFEQVAAAGGKVVKYIYYPFADGWREEVSRYTTWAEELGLTTKMHAGGTSYQGHSVAADADLVVEVAPNVLGHVNGGPIPLPDRQLMAILERSRCAIEVILGGNLRLLRDLVCELRERGELSRLTVGTDTPGGNGTMPRGCLQVVAAIASLGEVDAATALRCATENVALAHGLSEGALRAGAPADLLLVGPVRGSAHGSVQEALESGEIFGIGAVISQASVVGLPARYTPPPASLPAVVA